MQFVLSLKGTQFISGGIKLATFCFGLWQCTIRENCALKAPGVSMKTSILPVVGIIMWLQLLTWFAFLMILTLPSSSHRPARSRSSGPTSSGRGTRRGSGRSSSRSAPVAQRAARPLQEAALEECRRLGRGWRQRWRRRAKEPPVASGI